MMVNCDICRIVLCEKDLPFHNNGKKHLKNLVRMKLHLTSITRTITNSSCINDESKEQTNKEKESMVMNEETVPTNPDAPIKNEDAIAAPKPTVDVTAAPKPTEDVTAAPKPTEDPVKEAAKDKKHQKQQQETQKRRPKRKLRDDSLKPPLIPVVYINNALSFDQQVINFIMQVEQTQNEWANIKWVLHDVEYTFGHVIPGVKPVLYGSSFSGLAFKTSDIDVYLYDTRGGEPDREFIQRDGSIIYRFRLFTNIIRIPNARVPVIKATHIATGIDLDISATSGQAVANSRMLRFLLSHDWRIRSLMMLLGYLGKKYTLIGVNKFSRYSINLLIIFYLQNLTSPILPPLNHIVFGSPGRTWPYAFNENPFKLMNCNKQPLAEIFIGFFEFYLNFPFSKYVISTYCGEKIAQEDMEKDDFLNKMIYYKHFIQNGGDKLVYRCICVQDPLELSHNTTKGINEKVLQQFKFICTNALKVKQAAHERDWLVDLLNMDYVPPSPQKYGNGPVSFNVKYMYSGDEWITSIKKSLELVFWALGMDIDWNYPVAEDDKKKTKLSPGLPFGIETRRYLYPKALKWSLNQLRVGNFNWHQFRDTLLESSETKHQTVLSARCYVTLDQPNIVRLTMHNNCTNRHFYNVIPILKNNFALLLRQAAGDQTKQ